MHYFNFNGKILEASTAIFGPDSRAVRYGDGIFETLKLKDGHIILGNEHFARMWKGMQQLKFEIPKLLSPEKLAAETLQLVAKNGYNNCRIRIAIYRGNGGLYDAANLAANYVIQAWPLAAENGMLNSNGLQLCMYRDAQKNADTFSNLKHNNYLPYIMGALYAKELKCNDAIILNSHGHICDSTIANVFIIKEKIIYTPPLTGGCVAGVMRKFLLQALPDAGFEVEEKVITTDELLAADEVFLTNSIYNIRWVAAIQDHSYSCHYISLIDAALRQTNAATFC